MGVGSVRQGMLAGERPDWSRLQTQEYDCIDVLRGKRQALQIVLTVSLLVPVALPASCTVCLCYLALAICLIIC